MLASLVICCGFSPHTSSTAGMVGFGGCAPVPGSWARSYERVVTLACKEQEKW